VQWESSKKIIVQLPPNANIALQMANFQNIEIQVRFCPGDPAERERWLAYNAAYHQWTKEHRGLESDEELRFSRTEP
jgi:hypothetical protein